MPFRNLGSAQNLASASTGEPGATAVAFWARAGFVLFCAFAAYISLVPFNFAFVAPMAMLDRFARSAEYTIHSPVNFGANIALFVPIGALGAEVFIGPRRALRAAAGLLALILVSLLLSVCVEVLQVLVPSRTPSLADIAAQIIGTAAGLATWCAVSPKVHAWTADPRPGATMLESLLMVYVGLWYVSTLMPLDVTFSLSTLVEKYRAGRIVMNPFDSVALGREFPLSIASALLLCSPIGYLAAVVDTRRRRRSILDAVLLGATAIALAEMAQVFVFSRDADIGDVVNGALAVVAGATLAARSTRMAAETSRLAAWPLAGLVMASASCVVYNWSPFDFVLSGDFVRPRLAQLFQIPFVSYYQGLELPALANGLMKTAMGIPLGALALATVKRPETRHGDNVTTVVILVLGVLFLSGIELGQVLLPSRYPDVTDVFLTTAGIWFGVRLSQSRRK